ncbi:MAG TPA: hypothetical protein VFP46_01400 [Candidatus Paceibacterota bacterium]|nr:hypothetical protein [Candidatus Paceibacterota bacterium]
MWKQWINALLGLAVIAVPFLGLTGSAFTWTFVVMGVLIAGLSIWTMSEVPREAYERLTHERHSHA